METMIAPINDSSEGLEKKKATVRIVIADDHPIVRDGLKKLLLLEDDELAKELRQIQDRDYAEGDDP